MIEPKAIEFARQNQRTLQLMRERRRQMLLRKPATSEQLQDLENSFKKVRTNKGAR